MTPTTLPAAQRVVFLDIDGTILDHRGHVADSTKIAIKQARSAGHLILVCTGRSVVDIPESVSSIGFHGVVSGSGARATVTGQLILDRPMTPADVRRVANLLDAQHATYFLQTATGIFANEEVRAALQEMRSSLYGADTADAMPAIQSIDTADWLTVEKFIAMSEHSSMAEAVTVELGDDFHVVAGSMPLPVNSQVEITARGTSKGTAVLAVLDHLGIPAARSIGIGDSWNDAEMFDVCGISIAMGNADPSLQRLTDAVTSSVQEDGVWRAFRDLDLIPNCADSYDHLEAAPSQ